MILPLEIALSRVAKYVCSNCWRTLMTRSAAGHNLEVYCVHCGDDIHFVTKAYAEKKRQEDASDYQEALHNLKEYFPQPATGETKEQIMKDLGF
jgi:DNA-directed RNA polymerase subunit RPC12/RpoP